MDEESREFLEGRIYPIDETTFLIDEKWLEAFVRNMIDKVLKERAEKQTKKHDRWIYTENK